MGARRAALLGYRLARMSAFVSGRGHGLSTRAKVAG
jgi:hypothetical protein